MSLTLKDLEPVVDKLGKHVKTEDDFMKYLNELGKQVFEEDKLPKDVLGFKDKTLDELYELAYNLYNYGQYPFASSLFYHLFLLNPKASSYSYGLGACYAEMKNYPLAIYCFGMSYMNNIKNPKPLFDAAECCLTLKREEQAIGFLKQLLSSVERFGGASSTLKSKAELMLNKLEKNKKS